MVITELFDPAPQGHHSEQDDQSTLKIGDSRKNRERLTLAHINQLRQSYDVRKLEHEKKLNSVSKQYKAAAEPGAAPLGI